MVRYAFYGVVTNKTAEEVLKELRKTSKNVVGCMVLNFENVVYVDFEKDPTSKELQSIIKTLGASSYEKVEEETVELI